MYKGKRIGVVTAAYNEEKFIEEVVRTMPPFVDRIFVTNDCSTDATASILAGINDGRLVVTSHEQRMGPGAATLSGYKRARDEISSFADPARSIQRRDVYLQCCW